MKLRRLLVEQTVIEATSGGALGAANGPVVPVAMVAREVAPWCLTRRIIYDQAFSPASGAPNINDRKTLLSPAQAVVAVENGESSLDDCVGLGTLAAAWAKGARAAVVVAVTGIWPAYVLIGSKNITRLQYPTLGSPSLISAT